MGRKVEWGTRGYEFLQLIIRWKFLGDTPEIFVDFVIFSHFTWYGVEVSDQRMRRNYQGGEYHLPISSEMYLVCREFYQSKKVVSV